jgi:hypothetical protein
MEQFTVGHHDRKSSATQWSLFRTTAADASRYLSVSSVLVSRKAAVQLVAARAHTHTATRMREVHAVIGRMDPVKQAISIVVVTVILYARCLLGNSFSVSAGDAAAAAAAAAAPTHSWHRRVASRAQLRRPPTTD